MNLVGQRGIPFKKLLTACCLLVALAASAQEKKVVFVIVDGIAEDMLSKTETPHLDAIAAEGTLLPTYVGGEKEGYSQTPTISAVGYNTLLTGTWVNKHNVFGNGIKAPNYNYPTIFSLFSKAYPNKTTAIFSTWEDNRTKLLGEAEGITKVSRSFDGFELDTVNFPHDNKSDYIKQIDQKVALEAARAIKEEAPDLSWVYLQYTDDMGHRYGDSPALYEAITFEDNLIGKLYEAIAYREKEFGEDWLFIITTDHGRGEEDGKHHGGQTDRQRHIWTVINKKQHSGYADNHRIAMVDLLPTMVDFLDLDVSKKVKEEWDGVSLFAPVDMIDFKGVYQADSKRIDFQWEALGKGEATLLVSTTNKTKEGGMDTYQELGRVDLSDQAYSLDLSKLPVADFYKFRLVSEHTDLNTWILSKL